MQKARRHILTMLRPLVGRRVQGLFHSPARGSFHLSLTVLVRYRSLGVFSLTGWAPQFHARFLVPRATQDATRLQSSVVYGVFTLYDRLFQGVPLDSILPRRGPTTPCRLDDMGLGSSVFARHYLRNHCLFSPLWVLRCFSSPRSPPLRDDRLQPAGLPIRISRDQRLFAPPPGFSQLITSFVASESQGIHRLPLLTFSHLALDARVDIS